MHASEQAAARWRESIVGGSVASVRIVDDESRAIYGSWGLGLTDLRHFLGARSVTAAMRLARHGVRNRHPVGTRWQQAGTFAIDTGGVVRWRHIPAHAGDLPRMTEAVRALRGG